MGEKLMICLPYAGGSSYIFNPWKNYFNQRDIIIKGLEYPGRGTKMRDAFCNSLNELVEKLFNEIKKDILLNDYAFFGHSMGSLVAYELTKKIEKEQLPKPLHLFASGMNVPWENYRNLGIHLLPDHDFFQEIQQLGGIPEELTSHPELLQLFIPILKSDFQLLNEHTFTRYSLDVELTCVNGETDYTREEINEWKNATLKDSHFYFLPGGHFYLNSEANKQKLFEIIDYHLKN